MTTCERGSALLAVLWLSAALAAIAFSLSTTVRGETERESTAVDGLRSYYLASGAVERAMLELLWSTNMSEGRLIKPGATWVKYEFPSGDVRVEIIPETSRIDVNRATPERLFRLLTALGVESDRAREIATAIVDWRSPSPGGESPFDGYYLSLTPSFRPSHASFQEIEELLLVKGVTPDIFYGTYAPQGEQEGGPRLVPRAGLVDCLTVYQGRGEEVDANTANPAVLMAMGMNPMAAAALVERRNQAPLTPSQLTEFLGAVGAASGAFRVEGNSIVSFRATARLRLPDGRLSDLKRTVAAQVKYLPTDRFTDPFHILRWYDTAWSY